MKILMPTTEFPPAPGGISVVAWEQAQGLARLGHEVLVETLDFSQFGPPPESHPNCKVNYRPVLARSIVRLVPLILRNIRAARAFRPDVVLCPQYRGTGIPAVIAAKFAGAPLVMYAHGNEYKTELDSAVRRNLASWNLTNACRILTNSSNTRQLLHKWYPHITATASVVHPAIHREILQSAKAIQEGQVLRAQWLEQLGLPATNGTILFGSLSRITEQKGIDLTIRALAKVLLHAGDLKLAYIVGGIGPDLEKFRAMARSLKIENRVAFIGPITYPENTAFFNAIDIFVQPSQPVFNLIESFGISPLEAQACGKPVISTNWGGLPEAVDKDKSGILIPTQNFPALVEAMTKLASDPILRRQMANAGRAHAEEFSWDHHVEQVERVLIEAVEEYRSRKH